MFTKKQRQHISYSWKHHQAFLEVEKKLLGHNTLRGLLHDIDKIVLYCFLPVEFVHKCHVFYSRHHERRARTHDDFVQMVIDWECARFTKPDKPLNAEETLFKFYPLLVEEVYPILIELGLCPLQLIVKKIIGPKGIYIDKTLELR